MRKSAPALLTPKKKIDFQLEIYLFHLSNEQ
jgi:hypothetical protein